MGGAGSSPSETISNSLIQRLQAGNDQAWHRLLELYAPLVFSWCRSAGLQPQDAADVVQEVFQAVFRTVRNFRRDKPGDTFRGWLRTITKNKVCDHYRSRAQQPRAQGGTDAQLRLLDVVTEETQGSAGFDPFAALVQRAVRRIRDEFEKRTWQAFWLASVHQRRSADVAEQLGMSAGSVRQAKYKVLRRLRQELGDAD